MQFMYLDVVQSGLYEYECDRGHQVSLVLQDQLFELLFEIGANAIIDGYYREAVVSFASSLKRYYEFAIDIFREHAGVDESDYKKAWKATSRSEQQFGAYVFMHLATLKRAPATLPNSRISFRNDVVHNGKIPDKADALAFGNAVRLLLLEGIRELKANFAEEILAASFRRIRAVKAGLPQGKVYTGSMVARVVSLTSGDLPETLEQALEEVETARRLRVAFNMAAKALATPTPG